MTTQLPMRRRPIAVTVLVPGPDGIYVPATRWPTWRAHRPGLPSILWLVAYLGLTFLRLMQPAPRNPDQEWYASLQRSDPAAYAELQRLWPDGSHSVR